MKAWEILQKQKKNQAHLAEIPSAQIAHILTMVNSSGKGKPPTLSDFMFFASSKNEDGFPPDAAAVAVALLHEKKCPPLLIGIWPEIDKAAKDNSQVPKIRALKSPCGNVWAIAPKMESGQMKSVITVSNGIRGKVDLLDIDRPFYRITVMVPEGKPYQYIEETSLPITSTG